VESERPFTKLPDDVPPPWEGGEDALQVELLSRGMRILLWQLVLYLAISLVGSLAFLGGRFADFPYAWF
jgi:hypothetical protein